LARGREVPNEQHGQWGRGSFQMSSMVSGVEGGSK
jgi:hypothetical protein